MLQSKNRFLALLLTLLVLGCGTSCASDEPMQNEPAGDDTNTTAFFGGKKTLVAYFSWGGTTQRMAQQIQTITGADIFRIEPVEPYPTEYQPCTVVAREEKETNARPAIKDRVEGWDDYDVVFIGCPVWWWTTPMIIHTFCESYDFAGKTVVPFCTYAATYRDETLAEIVASTPAADHLTGEGLTGSSITERRIRSWLDQINEEWNESHAAVEAVDAASDAPEQLYDLSGRPVAADTANHGIYIIRRGATAAKVLR